MLRLIIPTIAMACLCSLSFADQHQDREFVKKLVGIWEIEEGKNQGEDLTKDELEGKVIIDEREIVTYDKENKEIYRATYTVNTSKDPVQITMKSKQKGQTTEALGILKLEPEDNEMWLCYGLPGSPRPTKFKSPGNSQNMLFELQQQ